MFPAASGYRASRDAEPCRSQNSSLTEDTKDPIYLGQWIFTALNQVLNPSQSGTTKHKGK